MTELSTTEAESAGEWMWERGLGPQYISSHIASYGTRMMQHLDREPELGSSPPATTLTLLRSCSYRRALAVQSCSTACSLIVLHAAIRAKQPLTGAN